MKKSSKTTRKRKSKKKDEVTLSSNYMDTSPYEYDNIELNLTQLRYGIIDSCEVVGLGLPEGTIEINQSWIEVLLILIDSLIETHETQEQLQETLNKYEITNQSFCIDKIYGKYAFEGKQYKAYKIYDREYYLEYIGESSVIFHALAGLTKSLNLELNEISFRLRNKAELTNERKFGIIEYNEKIVKIGELEKELGTGVYIESINFLGQEIKVKSLEQILLIVCKMISDSYNESVLLDIADLENTKSIGITKKKATSEKNGVIYQQIPGTKLFIYTNRDTKATINFIIYAVNLVAEDLEVKIKKLERAKRKEWETD